MQVYDIFPKRIHPALLWAGKADWWRIAEDGRGNLCPVWDSKLCPPELRRLVDLVDHEPGSLFHLVAAGRLLLHGPKCLCASRDVCEALAHVELRLPLSEYVQPYPALLVEYDRSWADSISRPATVTARGGPLCALLWQHRPGSILLCTLMFPGGHDDMSITFAPTNRANLEDILGLGESDPGNLNPEEVEYVVPFHRVALNYALIAANYGLVSRGFADPRRRVKHERMAGERGELFRAGDLELFYLPQEIKLHASLGEPRGGGVGGPVRPHWRRGHLRRQPCGPGRAARKLAFIRPVLVHAASVPDQSRTSVVYGGLPGGAGTGPADTGRLPPGALDGQAHYEDAGDGQHEH